MLIIKDKSFLYSVAALVGSIVGVGIFAIPFTFAKAGFWFGVVFLFIVAGLITIINLMYGEVILRTQSQHQIVGYANIYLGLFFKRLAFFCTVFISYAALLAYIVVVGEFLSNVLFFFKITPEQYSYIFFIILSGLVLLGIKRVSWIELTLTSLFIFVVGLIAISALPQLELSNLSAHSSHYWFLPYGVLVFAFAGFAGVPLQKEILVGKEQLLKKSIILSMIIVSCLYFIFSFAVVGVSGEATSPDAIRGLYEFLGEKIIFLGSLFGVFAISTAYLMLGCALREVFELDYGIKKLFSWLLVIFPPIVLFWGRVRTFVDIIGLAGSVALGLEMAILVAIYLKAKTKGNRMPEYDLSIPRIILYIFLAIFLSGVVYALVHSPIY